MTKELAKQGSKELAHHNHDADVDVLPSDFLADYVVLCQGLSKWVQKREAVMGDIVKSTSAKKVGGVGAKANDPTVPVETIFLGKPQTYWIHEKEVQGKFTYDSMEPRTAGNADAPWEYTKDGVKMRRVQTMRVYALLYQDLLDAEANKKLVEAGELPDPTKALMPVIFSFRGNSYKAGKELATFYAQCKSFNAALYRYVLPVSCEFRENDKGAFYVYTIDRSKYKPVPKEFLADIEKWSAIAASGVIKADESAEISEVEVDAAPAPTERVVKSKSAEDAAKRF